MKRRAMTRMPMVLAEAGMKTAGVPSSNGGASIRSASWYCCCLVTCCFSLACDDGVRWSGGAPALVVMIVGLAAVAAVAVVVIVVDWRFALLLLLDEFELAT